MVKETEDKTGASTALVVTAGDNPPQLDKLLNIDLHLQTHNPVRCRLNGNRTEFGVSPVYDGRV